MSKIAIATFYEAPNYGAFLQGFALQSFLKNEGYDSVFLKHKANSISYPNGNNKEDEFAKKLNNEIVNKINLLNIERDYYYENNHKYDAVILGSDEIWNLSNSNYKKLPIFWGRKVKSNKVISYAPSAGAMGIKRFLSHPLNIYSINKMKAIAVRDDNTEYLLKKVTRKQIKRVLDPTFLIEYDKFIPKIQKDNYILVYSYGLNNIQKEWILKYAKENNKKIIYTGSYCEWADENLAVDPFQWLALIKNSDYVFTSTFHGTVFSIIFRKQFVSIGQNQKIKSLLKEFKLENRLIDNECKFNNGITNNIEYGKINSLIKDKINISKGYLLENI